MLTTTFIDREVRMLRARGVAIDIVSLRRAPGTLSPEQQELAATTRYVRPIRVGTLVRRHVGFFARSPRRYVGALRELVGGRDQRLRDRVRSIGHFGLAVHVAGEVREHGRPRHVHAHFIDRAAAVAMVVSRLLDLPYSITAHASDIYVDPVLLEEKIRGASFVTTCTEHNRAHLASHVNGAGAKVELLYHGLELDRYRHTDGASTEPSLVPTLLAVGQLKEKKGFTHLIRACRALADQGIDHRCEIIGEGPQRAELEACIRDLGLEGRVVLRGALPHGDVIDAYARASVFVLPCVVAENGDRDGIPNVVLEAMAMGLAVVSTTVSGIPEAVLDGETGILVEPRDPETLAAALRRVVEDPAVAGRLGANGRLLVEQRFDASANAEALFRRFAADEVVA